MPVKVQGKLVVTKEKKGQLPESKETDLAHKVVPDDHAMVGVDFSRKWTDGNYGSTSVGVFIRLPCAAPDVAATYEAAVKFADSKMKELLQGTDLWGSSAT